MPIPRVERFDGDGTTVAFDLLGPIHDRTELVFVDGPLISRSGYSISVDLKTITLTVPPQAGTGNVAVMYQEADA